MVQSGIGEGSGPTDLIRLVQVEGDGAGAGSGAVPAEVLGTVEAGTGHVHSCVIDLWVDKRGR